MYVKTKTLNFSLCKRGALVNMKGLYLFSKHSYVLLVVLQNIYSALEKLTQIAK